MKHRIITIAVILSISQVYCLESKILKSIGKFMPNFTEIAFVTDIVNVYLQVSGFVRTTNQLLKNVKSTQQQWNVMASQLDEMYGSIKNLRDIDLYNMDTWSQALDRAEVIMRYDVADILQSFNMLEYYSLGAGERYLQSIQSLDDYASAMQSRKKTVNKLFLTNDYENALRTFQNTISTYKTTTREVLEQMLTNETVIYNNTNDEVKKAESKKHIESLEEQIRDLDESFSIQYSTKLDTIMDESSSMVAANLTEIQLAAQKIKEMQDNAMSLVDSYEKLKNGNISTNKKQNILLQDPSLDLSKYDSKDPDKVPAPATPEDVTPREVKKKTVGNEDIKNMQNAVDYLMYKQEALMRDIEILKCNTMAFILSMEAYRQNAIEQDVFAMAHGGKVMQRRIEK